MHRSQQEPRRTRRTAETVSLAVIGGAAGVLSGFPAGALLGSMLLVGAYNVRWDGRAHLPPPVRDGARVLTGTAVGSLTTASVLAALGGYLPWVAGSTVLIIVVALGCGWAMARATGLDLATCLLACSPGGLPEMSALADDLGAQAEVVVGLHVLRKLVALTVVLALVAQVA